MTGDRQQLSRLNSIKFDPSINLGHIGVLIGILVSGGMTYMQLRATQEAQGANIARIEKQMDAVQTDRKEARRSIEQSFLEKMNDQKTLIQEVALATGQHIAEIKAAILRLEDKLDRKADRVGADRVGAVR